LEFADEQRRPAGVIAAPDVPADPTMFPKDELCVEDGVPTGFALRQLPNAEGRNLIAVPECGAHAVRFFWTAPATSVGTVWMAGGVVHSDEQASPSGDGVTLLRRPLPSVAGMTYARELASGCSVASGTHGSSSWLLSSTFAGLLALGTSRARRRRAVQNQNVGREERA
jgi:MYXO-CTERM domain-containing protein